MRYSDSADGELRANVHVILRFTHDEIKEIKELAKKDGANWRTWIGYHAALGVDEAMMTEDGASEQRYGRGGG